VKLVIPFSGSSLFSVGEDEIQRNNQENRKSGHSHPIEEARGG